MFTIDKLLQPATLTEAAEILTDSPDVVVLGGCGFLKMGSRRIGTAMDLSRCGLGSITESDGFIRIGAMTTLHDMETNQPLNHLFDATFSPGYRKYFGNAISPMRNGRSFRIF
jgi:CO/xanthine dehydrogenase FAD-binding subunit